METVNMENTEKILYRLTISIVTFNNADMIEGAIDSILLSTLPPDRYRVIVVDNSSTDGTPGIVAQKYPQVQLIRSGNVGFGAGHNQAIREIMGTSQYHLVMNPDVYFNRNVLEKLLDYMDKHTDIGWLMPRVLYMDNSVQHLCKRLPTPFDLIARRFIPGFLKPLFAKRFARYEFRDKNYNETMEVPHLSGCFMMLRSKVFETTGLFDERFFLYLEDVDYSRRIHTRFKTVYYPEIYIYHHYHKGSYKNWKNLKYHVVSAIKYFNKWGWFFDSERRKINSKK